MKFLTVILSLMGNALKFFQMLYDDRGGAEARWRKKYDLLRKQLNGLRDLHAKALLDGNDASVSVYYEQWMQTSKSLKAHRVTGQQKGYID